MRDKTPKGSIVIPCPNCHKPRDFSHLLDIVTDPEILIPLIAVEDCETCRKIEILHQLENGGIIICTRREIYGSEKAQVYKRRVK